MHDDYFTNRLILRRLGEDSTNEVLRFYSEGRNFFNPFEPLKPHNFYTPAYQAAQLRAEEAAFIRGESARYFLLLKEFPERIIGTISFSNIRRYPYDSCVIGYKISPEYIHSGYAYEAVRALVTMMFNAEHMHRIEAYTLPDNIPSIKLLLRTGFNFEAVAQSIIKLRNGWTDHHRYVLINNRK